MVTGVDEKEWKEIEQMVTGKPIWWALTETKSKHIEWSECKTS